MADGKRLDEWTAEDAPAREAIIASMRAGLSKKVTIEQILGLIEAADLAGLIGTTLQGFDATLAALASLNTTAGMVIQTGDDAFTKRTLTGTADQIAVANGNGAAGNPTISLPNPTTFPGAVNVPSGAFTSRGIADGATGLRLQIGDTTIRVGDNIAASIFSILRHNNDGQLNISAAQSASNGATIRLYGTSHATKAGDLEFDVSANTRWSYDHSADTFFTPSIVARGTFGSGVGNYGFQLSGATGIVVDVASDGAQCARFNRSDSGTANLPIMSFLRGTASLSGISATNTTVTYSTSSDYRMKENVVDMSGAIELLKQLSPKFFTWKENPDVGPVHGFLAHEAQGIIPEAVTGEKDAVNDDGSPAYQAVDLAKFVPLMVGALQEAVKRIEALEKAA